MSDSQYVIMTLDHPWGLTDETVRIFPPCQVKEVVFRGHGPVVVFTKGPRDENWKRKRISIYDLWPSGGFVAWDDDNNEYAWHEAGTIDVPEAKSPTRFTPIILGETEDVVAGAGSPRRAPRARGNWRDRFVDWWDSKSRDTQDLDFLRKDT